MQVLLCGALSKDTNIIEDVNRQVTRLERPGGSVIHAANAYAKLDGSPTVSFASTNADYKNAKSVWSPTVNLNHQPSISTVQYVNRYLAGQARSQKIASLSDPLYLPDIDLNTYDLIHLAPLHHNDLHSDWLNMSYTGTIGLDIQGLCRPANVGKVTLSAHPNLVDYVNRADIVKASEREFNMLLSTLETDQKRLLNAFPNTTFLMTRGEFGGVRLRQGSHPIIWQTSRLPPSTDLTGAGDMFFACYLTLSRRRDESIALRLSDWLTRRWLGQQVFYRSATTNTHGVSNYGC